jgi:hypothetical protein
MSVSLLRLYLVGSLALVPRAVASQTTVYTDSVDWARYKPGSLRQYIRDKTPAALDGVTPEEKVFAVGAPNPIRARVVFLGKTRPLPPGRIQFIGGWARSQRLDSAEVMDLYKREVLVREGQTRFWIPVQESAWNNSGDLWTRNRPIVLLVQTIGARVVNRVPDWLFLGMTAELPPGA